MEKVVVELEAKTGKAEASLQDVVNAIQDINKATVESNKDTAKSLKEVEKSSGQAAKGIKAIGTGLKALGIGLVIAALGTLKDLFSQNQKVVDVFNTTFEFAGQVVSQATTAFTKIYDALSKSTDQFDALGKVASGLVTIAITPLKLAFYGVQLGIDTAMLAWEKSFLGDKNPETIKALNLSIIETKTNILEVGAAALEAGKDVATNFVEAVAEVGAAQLASMSDPCAIGQLVELFKFFSHSARQATAELRLKTNSDPDEQSEARYTAQQRWADCQFLSTVVAEALSSTPESVQLPAGARAH